MIKFLYKELTSGNININMNPIELLKDVKLEYVRRNFSTGALVFNGKKNGEILILIVTLQPSIDIDINEFSNYFKVFDNQRYYKFEGKSDSIEKELTIIYPASDADLNKYGKREKRMILETPEIYYNEILPKIVSQDLTWIYNIFSKKCEVEDILYEDEHFVLLPDLKWDRKTMDSLYCLAIFKDGSIRSIRDIKGEHVQLLNHINNKTFETIEKIYNIPKEQLRSYFHYRPSFWHAHIHFNLISCPITGASIDVAHSVSSIIRNIQIKSDYYQAADLKTIKIDLLD